MNKLMVVLSLVSLAFAAKAETYTWTGGDTASGDWKFEEKRSDVNLATSMLRDAYTNAADSFVLISGDSDFIAPPAALGSRGTAVVGFGVVVL